jgi:predicted nucleic acid-binding protein
MRVVSDTSPLCYLLLIDQIDLLPALFERILIPRAVAAELSHPGAAQRIREWIATPPSWLGVLDAPEPTPALSRLDRGESEAISLAETLKVDLVILDERKARQAAAERGLSVTGLLGILALSSDRGLVDLPSVLALLQQTSFRAEPRLFKFLLDRS